MSRVSEDEIRALATLARLALSEDEVCSLQSELSGILEHMEALAEVDTEGVIPMSHPMPSSQALRVDESRPSLDRERVLANSPRHDDESFVVPAILPGSGS